MPTIKTILDTLRSENRLRVIPAFDSTGMLDMSSNDYLSLAARQGEFREEFLDRFPDVAFSSSASRLLSTKQKIHLDLEGYLEDLYGKPALLFNSGYHANVGCIGALTIPRTLFVCDKLVHASIVDGLRMAGSEFRRFPHNDIEKLTKTVEKESPLNERIVIVVESIYSMDGDEAPLADLVELKRRFGNVILYVDEAHAFGVRGDRGLGLAEEKGIIRDVDLLIGTFGKAAASAGAFAICSDLMKSLLVNCARPFIFSTALPPVNIAWSRLMVEKITQMNCERRCLSEISSAFSGMLEEVTGKPIGSTSQIIPLLTGDSAKALAAADTLFRHGVIALPIRRPTVPPGGERIRFSLCAEMDRQRLEEVCDVIRLIHEEDGL